MRYVTLGLSLAAFAGLWLLAGDLSAQQVTVGTPFHSLNDSFYEHMGSSWSLKGKGWNASFGAPNNAAPQFGGFQPGAGANFGFGMMGPGMSGQFSGNWSQGYRQSFVSQTPSITLPNGGTGVISDSSLSPFVMGYIPVVGGFPVVGSMMPAMPPPYAMPPQGSAASAGNMAVQEALRRAKTKANQASASRLPDPRVDDILLPAEKKPAVPAKAPAQGKQDDLVLVGAGSPAAEAGDRLARAQASTAGRAAPSVQEARQLRAAQQATHDDDAVKYLEMGRTAEESGKPTVAKIYYQMAARRASGELKDQILSRIEALKNQSAAEQ